MRWLVWVPDDMTRDEAVVYIKPLTHVPVPVDRTGDAYKRWIEVNSQRIAEEYAEVRFYDDGGERRDPYTMNVSAVDDGDAEIAMFEFEVDIEFNPTFSATKRTNVKE